MQEAEANIEETNRQALAIAKVFSKETFENSQKAEARALTRAHNLGSAMTEGLDGLDDWPEG